MTWERRKHDEHGIDLSAHDLFLFCLSAVCLFVCLFVCLYTTDYAMLNYKSIDTERGNQGLGRTSVKQLAKSVIHRIEHTKRSKTGTLIVTYRSIEIAQIIGVPYNLTNT